MSTSASHSSQPGESQDAMSRMRGAAELPPGSPELAELLATDPTPEVRMTAARRCSDLHSLVKAWKRESDQRVRDALAAALCDVLSASNDSESLALLLRADDCTDAIRSDIASRRAIERT